MKEIKPIIIHDSESKKDYVLEYNREAIKFAESRGFNINDLESKPMSKIPELFFYAFRMHHKNISREKTDKMLEDIGWSESLLGRLGELYAIPFETLLADEDEPKNSHLTVEL